MLPREHGPGVHRTGSSVSLPQCTVDESRLYLRLSVGIRAGIKWIAQYGDYVSIKMEPAK